MVYFFVINSDSLLSFSSDTAIASLILRNIRMQYNMHTSFVHCHWFVPFLCIISVVIMMFFLWHLEKKNTTEMKWRRKKKNWTNINKNLLTILDIIIPTLIYYFVRFILRWLPYCHHYYLWRWFCEMPEPFRLFILLPGIFYFL